MLRRAFRALLCLFIGIVASQPAQLLPGAEGDRTGEQIYQQLCASCHSAKGEGNTKQYALPLAGDKSVAELAKYIDKSMPEDDPEQCTGDDANKVAAYLYEAFYSPIAQARLKPPRVELARLTVRQYQQSLADLIGSFRGNSGQWTTERGLKAEYFKTRRMRNEERVIERVDPIVKFDFGEGSPDKDKFEPVEFSIRWQGSILAPDTGDYEFILQSENGARLWVNNNDKPLIDAGVKSGKDDRSETIQLIGGRIYPLRLETFKSKEAKEKRASISLKWKPPQHTVEVIPQRNLLPQWSPETYVVQTPFPPDDRSEGYERGNAISKAWEQSTTEAALEVADYVLANAKEITGRRDDGEDRQTKFREFSLRFTERAFRRPLTDEEKQFFVGRTFADSTTPELALKKVILLVLKSPRFLFRELGHDTADPYDLASRLSFGLWDSLPNEDLLSAAAGGRLVTPDQIAREAEGMLNNPRTQSKLREFFLQWLRVDRLTDISKDPERFPEFTPEVISDLRTSLDLFIDDVIKSDTADFRQLLLDDKLYLNGPLAKVYGVELATDADFQKVPLNSSERAGVLTHPYLMSGFAYTSTSSPIHRGVFVARSILGRALRPPPEAVAPLAPDLHASLTTRERVILQTQPESCQTCHAMINPLGFTFEHFDAIGRYQKEEQGKPIDATGAYLSRTGDQKQFANVRELATYLAASDEAHTALATQLFHHLVKQPVRAYGLRTPEELSRAFAQHNFNIRRLVVEIVTKAALTSRNSKPDISSR